MQHQPVAPYPAGILIDQGLADKFLPDQLHPHLLEAACAAIGQPLTLRRHAGYDHGYYFVQSFMADHLQHHARQLMAPPSAGASTRECALNSGAPQCAPCL